MKTKGIIAAPGVAPLRAIRSTRRVDVVVELGDGERSFKVPAVELHHELECGHQAEPLLRVGCRQPYPPKRRRCKKCQEENSR